MKHVLTILLTMSMCVSLAQKVKTLKTSENGISFSFDFELIQFNTKEYQGENYVDFSKSSEITIFKKGEPALPFYTKSILIPEKGNTSIQIIYSDYQEFSDKNILPSFGLKKRKDNPEEYIWGGVYSKNEFYPGKLATTTPPFILRELRGQTIHLYPYQYNPVSKTLRFYKNIQVNVKFENTSSENEIKFHSESNLGKLLFQDQFINVSKQKEKNRTKQEEGEMLIICPESYLSTIQPFADWKNQKGIKTKITTVESIGNDSIAIKKYVSDYYFNNHSLLFLLLVGDAENVTSYSYGNYDSDEYWSDSYYGQISGNDFFSELFVGRFSGNEENVKTMVDRTLEYEKNPASGNWMSRAIGIGSNQGLGIGDQGEADWQHERNIRSSLLENEYSFVYEFYDGNQGGADSASNPSAKEIINAINSGVGLLNYTGHGDTEYFVTSDFYSKDVLTATNYGKYPFVVSVACNNGKFVNNTCLSETWLNAKNNNQITGAIAMCGSTILMDWAPPMKTQDEIVRLLGNKDLTIRKYTLGGLFNNGQFSMLEKYGNEGKGVIQTWMFFGDPSTVFRNQITKPMEYSVDKFPNSIQINSPIETASIGISKDNEYIISGTIKNNSFNYTFPLTASKEKYTITLTKQNYGISQFEIVSDGKLSSSELNESSLFIFPNPVKNKLFINSESSFSFQLLSMEGKVIIEHTNCDEKSTIIDVSNLSTGMYLLQYTQNGTTFLKKISVH